MTNARDTQTSETVELSTNYGTIFLTGSEVAAIEEDPTLALSDVAQYRAEGER